MLVSNVEIGIAVGDADDRLGGQVEDGVDFVFAERALRYRLVADVAADDLDAFDQPRAHELGLRHPVAHQADDVGPGLGKRRDEPAADQAASRR